jgi:hypothetical protein
MGRLARLHIMKGRLAFLNGQPDEVAWHEEGSRMEVM